MESTPPRTALRVRDLSAGYGGTPVLQGVSFDVRAGALTGLIGPNGAGKSTLIKAVLGEIRSRGEVRIAGGQDLRDVAYVPQRSGIDFTFPITVEEVALQGTFAHLPWWRRPGRSERAWARECLEAVGMADFRNRSLGHLSGGQAARVFIARALAQQPRVFLLDEPFAAIDMASEERILDVLRERASAGDAVLIVHHNLTQVPSYFDDLIALNRTIVATGAVAEVFTPEVLAEAFPDAFAVAELARAHAHHAGRGASENSPAPEGEQR